MADNKYYTENQNTLYIYDFDEVYVQLSGDRSILKHISEYFTFDVPGKEFVPAYKEKLWDGKLRLLCWQTGRLYKGLLKYILLFCKNNNYKFILEDSLKNDIKGQSLDLNDFFKSLKLTLIPYDFQDRTIKYCLSKKRATVVSPTSSGKSLIAYIIIRWLLQNTTEKILITVPTIGLVNQLYNDFIEYDPEWNIADNIHKICEGSPDESHQRIYISTWQAIFRKKKPYFSQFGAVIIDEAHQGDANSLKGIMEKCVNADYRYGLSGTIKETKCHRAVIEGLFGPIIQFVTTRTLMDKGIVSDLNIKCLLLKYSDKDKKDFKKHISTTKNKYQGEIDFIVHCKKRNRFIGKIVSNMKDKSNCLILTDFHNKKEHVRLIKEEIEAVTDKTVITITGNSDAEARELVRKYTENNTNVVIIATFGTFSTGISIKNLQYLIFATNSKSMVKVLQSIGRSLRLDGKTNSVTVYDLIDELELSGKRNYLLRHFFERVKLYIIEKFKYKIVSINI